MKKLVLFLGLAIFSSIGALQVSAFLDYSPNCVPTPTSMCADPQLNDQSNNQPNDQQNNQSNNQSNSQNSPTSTSDNVPVPPTKPIDWPAVLYVSYESIEGHNIYAQSTYKGKGGEVVDLSNFKKDLTTFAFDHYLPSEGTITLQAGKYLRATLVYRKVFRPVPEVQKNSSQSQASTQSSKTSSQDQVSTQSSKPSSTSVYNSDEKKSSSAVSVGMEDSQVKLITGLFDDYFRKNAHMSREQKQAFLLALKTSFESASRTLSPQDTKNAEMYRIILMVIENYRV